MCGLLNVHGVIDGTHIQVSKPKTTFPEDYYYCKITSYSIVAQAIVNSKKQIIDICVGLPGNTNDYKVLHMFALYKHVQNQGLFDPRKGVNGFPSYLLGDKGYPLITWIMTPFKKEGQHSILEILYNRKHKRGRLVVENIFGILKKTFKELQKFELHVTFLHDVFTCCCLLHNLFKFENEASFARLFRIIKLEIGVHEEGHHRGGKESMNQARIEESSTNRRSKDISRFVLWRELSLYLGRQRNFQ